ncbi:MAG: glycogen/starch synthase [Candidatus Andersenbacteria bacterium]
MMRMFAKEKKHKILFVSTEIDPFAKVGGLGSVMHSLSKALNSLGHDARVMIPRYLDIGNDANIQVEYEGLKVPTGDEVGTELVCNVKKYTRNAEKGKPTTVYFLENMEYYEQRANVYGYADDPIRWALLCRGVLEFLKVSSWVPDVIICTDWQTGFLPNYLKTVYQDDKKLQTIATIFSIHNLGYQGTFNHKYIQESEYDDGHSPIPAFDDPRLMHINGLRRGIMFSDIVNTVSSTYSREIMDEEHGEGMDAILREKKSVVFGILNGIDYGMWNPLRDPMIERGFSIDTLEKRMDNKLAIQQYFNLQEDKDAFVVGIVSRLTSQKGFDLIMDGVIQSLLQELNMQLVVVGEGEEKYMKFFQALYEEHPEKVGIQLHFDHELPRKIFAGADAVLIPSLFEPSGLTQMEAMHYGTIPIVRKTGGLADTVIDYYPGNPKSTGFVFDTFDSSSFLIAVVRAYENFQNKTIWRKLQKTAMKKDFSWEHSAKEYEKLVRASITMRKGNA